MTTTQQTIPANHTMSACNAAASQGGSIPQTAAKAATPREVQRWLAEGSAILIDVREPDEHAREKITGARLLPLSRFDPQQAAAAIKPGQTLVLHCKSGRRSTDACRLAASLCDAGLSVVNMTGGIEAWKSAGLPVEVNTKVSGLSIMRQVQLVIGVGVLAGSALAWFVDPLFIGIPAFFGAGLTFAGTSGTCALASLIGMMPWNKAATGSAGACSSVGASATCSSAAGCSATASTASCGCSSGVCSSFGVDSSAIRC